jgi:uncharacterized protein (UPF0335 family)
MVALAERKLELIREVSRIEDEKTLAALLDAYRQITGESKKNGQPVKSIRQKFDADAIRRRRGRTGHDKAKIMQIIREMDVQEPIEQLLAQLTK